MALERYSNLGSLRQATFDAANPQGPTGDAASQQLFAAVFAVASDYAAAPTGWLTIAGPSGSGKSYLAAAIANRQIDLGKPALMITASNLLDYIRSSFDNSSETSFVDMFDHVRDAPLLILDDLPTTAVTPWGQERLLQLLVHRHSTRLPTVVVLRGNPAHADDVLLTRLETVDGFARMYTLGKIENIGARGLGGIPANMLMRMTFETFQPSANGALTAEQRQAFSVAQTYTQHWAERDDPDGWLMLMGPCGVGKTHLAVAAAAERQKRGDDVFFATVADLLDQLRAAYSPDSPISHVDLLQRVRTAELLVFDDMGAERSTAFAEDKLFQIVNYRYEERLPTIITTSSLPAEMDSVRPRIASRLFDRMLVTILPLNGPDYRRLPPS